MELRHLRYFVAVAKELNFTRAAEKLRLAQPSLTRQIHNLEEELGVRLLDRSKNQVTLTEEGKSFLVDATRLVALSLESITSVQRFKRGESSQLNLGYRFQFHCDFLPATLTTFHQNCPEITVRLFDMSPAEQLRAIETRKIDLGFVGLRATATDHDITELAWESILHSAVVAVLPTHHPLAKKEKINISDLKPYFFVAMSEDIYPGTHDWLSGLCRQGNFSPRILQEAHTESDIMRFVAEGLGVTLAREHIKTSPYPGVVFRPLAEAARADCWIAWHRENHSKPLTEYIRIVRKEATAQKWNHAPQPTRERRAEALT